MRRNAPCGIVPALLALVACSSGTATLEEEPVGPPVEVVEHTVTYTIDCSGYSEYCHAHSWSQFPLLGYDRGSEFNRVYGTAQRTTSCHAGNWLVLSVRPQGNDGVGRVSATISVDSTVVKTRSRSSRGLRGLLVWAICG